jgi:cytidylate kinase
MIKIIAIDGPSASGKTQIAKMLSKKLDAPLLISGLLYRYIALQIIEKKISLKNKNEILKCANNINENSLNSKKLYSPKIDNISSRISSIKDLRSRLLKYQRNFAKKYSGSKKYVIVEGRDIGTVIFPNADYKIFMWASSYIRAQRRASQIAETNKKPNISQIHNSIKTRDMRDMTRKTAPLVPAADSYLICTDFSDKEVTFNTIIKIIKKK